MAKTTSVKTATPRKPLSPEDDQAMAAFGRRMLPLAQEINRDRARAEAVAAAALLVPRQTPYRISDEDVRRVASRLEDLCALLNAMGRLTVLAECSGDDDDTAAVLITVRESAASAARVADAAIVALEGRSYTGIADISPLAAPGISPTSD